MDLENRVIQVDSYDFFGYLAPGTMALLAVIVSSVQIFSNVSLQVSIVLINSFLLSLKIEHFLFLTALFIICGYIFGHITGSLSASLFEKTIVGKILGYPYRSLVLKEGTQTDYSSWSYRAFIFLGYLFLLSFSLGWRVDFYFLSMHFDFYFCCLVGSVFVVLFVLKISDAPVSRIKLFRFGEYFHNISFFLFRKCGLLFYASERFNFHFQGQIKTFPDVVIDKIHNRYRDVFGVEINSDLKTEIFWGIYWYVANSNPFLRRRLSKWLVLYGFMRNMSFASLLSAVVIVIPSRFTHIESNSSEYFSVLFLILSVIFSFRYYYLYFGYYSKNIFRAFAYDEALNRGCSSRQTA